MKIATSRKGTLKVLILALSFSVLATSCGSSGDDQLYYVSLGDSLAVGLQQDPTTGESIETDEGYADQLFAALQQQYPNLQLVKFGCPRETTASMLEGGVCPDRYESGSQLEDAVVGLGAHPLAADQQTTRLTKKRGNARGGR